LRVRGDLHEIKPFALREGERARGRDDTERLAVSADQADGRDADLIVDPEFRYRRDPLPFAPAGSAGWRRAPEMVPRLRARPDR